jgi:hypothetical protein
VDESPQAKDSHDGHDELLIALLLDRDPSDPERSIAETRVARCPECAALHADLLALSKATTRLRAAVRTRDFRLTASDAARLTATAAGEPRGATARLIGEMTHPPTDHATHDQLLIASLLDRSAGDPDRDRAEALVAECDDCAALHRDLIALSEATRALATPPRLRDFTLSPDDVERLRPKGWRRMIAAFGSSRDIFSRPLAIGLTTLGLAGLLVATVPGVLSGQAGSSSALSSAGQSIGAAGANPESLGASRAAAAPPAPSAGPSVAAALVAPAAEPSIASAPLAPSPEALPSGPTYDAHVTGPAASSGAAAAAPESSTSKGREAYDATGTASTSAELPVGRSGVIVLAGLLLVVGLALFALRWTARRLGGR